MGSLAARPVQPFAVKRPVHVVGARRRAGVRAHPCSSESLVVLAPAFGARAVPGRQGGGLVQEEEAREPPRLHRRPPPAPVRKAARQPPPNLPVADEPSVLVVKDPAVAEQEPALGYGDDVAEGRDPVAQWHAATARSGLRAARSARPRLE